MGGYQGSCQLLSDSSAHEEQEAILLGGQGRCPIEGTVEEAHQGLPGSQAAGIGCEIWTTKCVHLALAPSELHP